MLIIVIESQSIDFIYAERKIEKGGLEKSIIVANNGATLEAISAYLVNAAINGDYQELVVKFQNITSLINERFNYDPTTKLYHIHYDSILYAEKNHTTIKEGETLQKILKKLATFDKTTQTWNLKSNEKILQAIRAKHKLKKANKE